MQKPPQVCLFGSIYGGWRESHVIPVLDELGVSYYHPFQEHGWTPQAGEVEAEVMKSCEVMIMVINTTTPAFTSLAETGWAALGCLLRNQHFILQVDLEFPVSLAPELTEYESGQNLQKIMQHWTTSSRYLVDKHAHAFDHPKMHIVRDLSAVGDKLREIYTR